MGYIALDETLEESTANDLFLSYHPASKTFMQDKPICGGKDLCTGVGSHAEILRMPYQWMAANPDQVISLNVHGNDQYDKVVFERYQKLEKAQNARQEQAKKES